MSRLRVASVFCLALFALPAAAAAAPVPPSGRAYELVTPGAHGGTDLGSAYGGPTFVSSDASGDTLLVPYPKATGDANTERGTGGYQAQVRSATGWSTRKVSDGADADVDPTFFYGLDSDFALPTSDRLGVAFYSTVSYGAPNPKPTTLADQSSAATQATYVFQPGRPRLWLTQPVTSAAAPAPGQFGDKGQSSYPLAWSDQDRSLLFAYRGTLGVPGEQPRTPGSWTLYERRNGVVTPAAALPGGSFDSDGAVLAGGPPPGGNAGAGSPEVGQTSAVSGDGSRVLFASPPPSGSRPDGTDDGRPPQLYVRLADGSSVLASRTSSGQPSPTGVIYSGSANLGLLSGDGSAAVFASRDALTSDAPADAGRKLYRFDVASRTVRFIRDTQDEGSVFGVRGIAEDGSTILFQDSDGLKAWRDGGLTVLTSGMPSTGNGPAHSTGATFAFTSNEPLDGTTDHPSGVQEAYRYRAGDAQATCVSCTAGGTSGASLDNVGFNIKAVRPRWLSDDGSSLVFSTIDALVPADVNGVSDAYEWRAGQGVRLLSTGNDPRGSFVLDASPSHDDIFIATVEALDARDANGNSDIYDVRRGGGFPVASPATGCSGDSCQPATPSPPGDAPAASTVVGTAGKGRRGRKPPGLRVRVLERGPESVRLRIRASTSGRLRIAGDEIAEKSIRFRRAGRRTTTVRLSAPARRDLARRGRVRVAMTLRFVAKDRLATERSVSTTIRLPRR